MPEITVFAGYAAAFAGYTAYLRDFDRVGLLRLAIALALATLLGHGYLLWWAVLGASTGNLSLGNTVSLSGWMLGLFGIALASKKQTRAVGPLFLLLAGIGALLTSPIISGTQAGDEPAWQFLSHAISATLAYSLMAAATILALLTLLKDRHLRQQGAFPWAGSLPALETMERLMFAAIGAGFVLLSLAIFSGLIFVDDLMAQHLAHKTVLTVLAWLVFGVLLLGRWRGGWRGQKAIHWTLGGFVLLALAYFGSRIILELLLGRTWG